MSLDAEALTDALNVIAEQDAPPSRVDADRARADGRRTMRRRRTAAGLGGTGAVALVAALALSAGHVFGGAPDGGAPAAQQTRHTADWDPLVAPGSFGWLPANAPNINYLIAPGPGQGSKALGKGSEIMDASGTSFPAMIWLSPLDPGQSAPTAASGDILIPAPEVNNRPAFWEVDPVKRDPDRGAGGVLYFQSPSGRWAEINAYYLGADPVAATLLHVARAAHIGNTAIALPVRISGLPADVSAPVAQLTRPTNISGAAWSLGLSFSMGADTDLVEVQVMPATAKLDSGTGATRHCKTSNGLLICVSTMNNHAPWYLSGGFDGLLRDITSLGADPAHWSTDVVVVP
jgi:hypothetical protein